MKVFLDPPKDLSLAMARVAEALRLYAPASVEVVNTVDEADAHIIHVIGYPETSELAKNGRPYALLQYCVRSTQEPKTDNWVPLWQDALAVWSYYDLSALMREDGFNEGISFYYAPLGVDTSVFYPRTTIPRNYGVLTSGFVAESEAVTEAAVAAVRARVKHFHLGPQLNLGPQVRYGFKIDDDALAYEYSRCQFVTGLRRCEGFELPAAEGVCCGARPIMFDRPHYRAWFHDLAEFIPEGDFQSVMTSLETLFRAGARPVTERELAEARLRFSWKRLVSAFWMRFLGASAGREVGQKLDSPIGAV